MLQEQTINIKDFEEKLYATVCQIGREIFAEVLEKLDNKLLVTRDRTVYRCKGLRKTVLKTVMGEVEYNRQVYVFKKEDGKRGTIYLLDEAIGKTGSGFLSEVLVERISEVVCEMPYRHVATTISELTGQSISHTTAWNVAQELGARVRALDSESVARAYDNNGTGELESKLLFEEQDGIWLHLQGRDRNRHGKSKEMKLAIAYDGAEKKGKERYELSNKVAYASFDGADEFYRDKEGIIAATYNVDEIETKVIGGDGASWIKRGALESDTIYQLDTFHRNQAIIRAAPDAKHRKTMLKLLYSKEIEHLLVYIETLADIVENKKQEEALRGLYKYFTKNKDGLISYNCRGIPLPEPPEGKEYRRLGAIESNVFSVIGNRMKGRRKCWSIEGGNNLARLLCLKGSGKLRGMVTSLAANMPEQYAEEVITTLSAAKSGESVGNGYNGFDAAEIPASQKWLKDIARIKQVSELFI
jgi:hypothetical protein